MSDPSATVENAIQYSIHYDPNGSELPQLPKGRIPGLRNRSLYAKFIVGHTQEVVRDLKEEQHLFFNASAQGIVRIELYAEHSGHDVIVASKECELASLALSKDSVHLEIEDERVSKKPILNVDVTYPSIEHHVMPELPVQREELTISDKWEKILRYTKVAVGITKAFGEVFPMSETAFTLLELALKILDRKMGSLANIISLVDETQRVCEIVVASNERGYKDKKKEQAKACNTLITEVLRVSAFLRSLASKNLVERSRTEVNKHVQDMLKRLQELARNVENGARLDTQDAVFRIEGKLDNERVSKHLPMALDAQAGSSKGCLDNTRGPLLDSIVHWISDPNASRCLLLHGAAGKGKSAVAHSVARLSAKFGAILTFFAFDRANQARRADQVLPTLTGQLAFRDPRFLQALQDLDPDQLATVDIRDQYEYLISTCLKQCSATSPVVFIIDALDECPEKEKSEIDAREAFLDILSIWISDLPAHANIKFLVTARPDNDDIQRMFRKIEPFLRRRSMDNVEGTERDILRFVQNKLRDTDVYDLVDDVARAAQDLFECAAVLCRELTRGRDRPKTEEARRVIAQHLRETPGLSLYDIYKAILDTNIGTADTHYLDLYRCLLSWVLKVQTPQPRFVFQDIAAVLWSQKDWNVVDTIFLDLGSLLTGTVADAEEPIRPLHTSFRDYVLEEGASKSYAIISEFGAADSQLAHACFRIMGRQTGGLRYNICNIPSPFVYKKDWDYLVRHNSRRLSPKLRYACREISAHLSRCHNNDDELVSALNRFLQDHFLFWIEACNWLGYNLVISIDPRGLKASQQEQHQDDLIDIITEFVAFEKRFRQAFSISPPQVYITAPLFAPVKSHIWKSYRPRVTIPIEISGYQQERVWSPSEALVIQTGDSVLSVAYSPDGTTIAAGLWGRHQIRLQMRNAETGRQVGSAMLGHENVVSSVAFSPDGSGIASGSWDHTIRLWDAKTWQQQGEALRGHTAYVRSVAFSPNSTTLVSGSDDRTLRLWDLKTGKEIGEAMNGHSGSVNCVVFSHDGTRIVSGAYDQTVRIWKAGTRQQLGDSLLGHEDWVRSVAMSRDDSCIVSGSDDGTIRVWDMATGQLLSTFQGHAGWVLAVAFSPDGQYIASGGRDHTIRIWHAASGQQTNDLRGHTDGVRSVAFSPDGKHVASASTDRTIRIWEVREVTTEAGTPVGYASAVTSVACSSDGKYIASGSEDQTVRLWDARTGQPVGDPMTGHDGVVNCVTFSPDDTRIASASDDKTVRVWDVETRLSVGEVLRGHGGRVLCVSFSPDGARLVSGSADLTLRLWGLKNWQQIGHALRGHEYWISSVGFSSDGLYIASGSCDCSMRFWDAHTQLQREDLLYGHVDGVRSIAFSPDGAFLVSASEAGTLRLWNMSTGEQTGEPMSGHTGQVLAVSPDGNYIASGSHLF